MNLQMINEGRAILYGRAIGDGTAFEGRPILEYNKERAAVRVGYTRRYRSRIKIGGGSPKEYFVCYIDKGLNVVERVERVKLKAIVDPSVWQISCHSDEKISHVFLLRKASDKVVKAAPILTREANRLVVGTPREYPTTLTSGTLDSMSKSDIDQCFIGEVVFGVIVNFQTAVKIPLERVKTELSRPS